MSIANESVLLTVEARDKASAVIEKITGVMGKFGADVESAGKKAGGGTDASGASAESATPKLMKLALVGGTVAAAAIEIGKRSVEAAQQYQQSTAVLAAHANISQQAADAVGKAFLSTAGDTTFSAQQMMEAFAPVAGQFSMLQGHALNAADSLTIMKASTDLAEASGSSLDETTKALANVMVTYHMNVSQASNASDILFNTSRLTGVGVSEVAQSVDRLKSRLGVAAPSLGDTATLMAELSSHGVSGSRGIMLVNTAMNTILGNSKNTSDELKKLGINVYDSSGKFVGMKTVIEELGPKLNGMTDAQRKQAETALFGASAGAVMDGVLRDGTGVWDSYAEKINEAGAAHENAEKMDATFQGSLEKLEAAVKDAGISLGTALLPVVTKFLSIVMQIIQPILQWVTAHQHLAATILLVAGVVGSLVTGLALLGMVIGAVGTALGMLLSPVGLIIAAIVALGIGIYELITHWNDVVHFVTGIWNGFLGWLKGVMGGFMTWWHSWWDPFFQVVSVVWDNIVNVAKMALAIILTIILTPLEIALRALADVWLWLWHSILEPVWNGIVTISKWAWDFILATIINPAIDNIRTMAAVWLWLWQNVITPVWQGIQQIIGITWNWILTNVVQPLIARVRDIADTFNWLWHNIIQPVWVGIQGAIATSWNWLRDNVFDPLYAIVHDHLVEAFNWARDRITDAWNMIKDAAKQPVQFIVDAVYNNGILPVWNAIADVVHVGHLNPVTLNFAQGGTVPGFSPGNDTVHAMLSPGEGILVPHAVRALGGAAGIDALNKRFGTGATSGFGHFGGGGIIGDIIGTIGNAVSQVGKWVAGGLSTAATPLVHGLEAAADGFLGTSTKDLPGWLDHGVHTLGDGFLSWLAGKDAASSAQNAAGNIGAPGGVSGNVAAWVAAAMAADGVSGSNWLNGLETIAGYESGGNPNAQNNWDVNAQNGDPSRGLMQTIGATFEAYRNASLPNDIFDPVANVAAAINYIKSRYGDIGNVPGLVSLAHGGGYVGYDNGGWLEPGYTLAFNGTGQREAITSPSGAGPHGAGITVVLDVHDNYGMPTQAFIDALMDRMGRELNIRLGQAGVQIRR